MIQRCHTNLRSPLLEKVNYLSLVWCPVRCDLDYLDTCPCVCVGWAIGAGGRISSTGGSSIGAYMRKVAALERAVEKDEDPREAILKYAKVLGFCYGLI